MILLTLVILGLIAYAVYSCLSPARAPEGGDDLPPSTPLS